MGLGGKEEPRGKATAVARAVREVQRGDKCRKLYDQIPRDADIDGIVRAAWNYERPDRRSRAGREGVTTCADRECTGRAHALC